MNLTVMIILLAGLVLSAMACIMLRDLLKASIAMAAVSAILSLIMFLLDAKLAAVFELSVCAGLITVIFISAISMTKLRTKEEIVELQKGRRRRFAMLPVVLIGVLAGTLLLLWPRLDMLIPYSAATFSGTETVADIFWNRRQTDLLGQVIIILAGVYGVLIFFKEREREEK